MSSVKNKKILLVTPFFYPNMGGVETYLNDLIEVFHQKNIPVDVVTYQPLTSSVRSSFFEQKPLLNIWRLPWIRGKWFYIFEKRHPFLQFIYLSTGIMAATLIYCLINIKNRKNIYIFSQGLAAGVAGMAAGKVFGYKRFLNLHTNYRLSPNGTLSRLVKYICQSHQKTLILSESAKENLVSIGVPSQKIVTYLNWVDENFFTLGSKVAARTKLHFSPASRIMLFVGRLSIEKGILDVLKIAGKIPRTKLIIIGVGPLESVVKSAQTKLKNLVFLGRKESFQLRDYLWASDFLIYAPVDEDYLGRTAISALCSGLPIIIPKIGHYMDRKTPVKISLPEKVGFMIDNTSDENTIDSIIKKTKNNYSSAYCRKYALKYYGRNINSQIIIKTIFNS